MGLIKRLFCSTASVAKDAEKDDEVIITAWKSYRKTISEKEQIINRLPYSYGERKNVLQKLMNLLDFELVEIRKEEKKEDDLVLDMENLEHSKRIKRVERLRYTLGCAEEKYRNAFRLLLHLESIMESEERLVRKLATADLRKYRKLTGDLKAELNQELNLIATTEKMGNFHELLCALVKGEHIVNEMNSREKRLVRLMQRRMTKIFSNELNEGVTHSWTMNVLTLTEDKIQEGISKGILEGHPNTDFEFVNRPEFVDLVRSVIYQLRIRNKGLSGGWGISEQMINVFVHSFREWFNYRD